MNTKLNKNERRVVITGIGAVSPVGNDTPGMWQSLIAGKSGVGYITHFDTTDFETKIAAEVKDFNISSYVDRKQGQRMDRFTQFAVAASMQAVEQAKLEIGPDIALEFGVKSLLSGTAPISGMDSSDKRKPKLVLQRLRSEHHQPVVGVDDIEAGIVGP